MISERAETVPRAASLRVPAAVALPLGVLVVGAVIRAGWFLERGSLWLDEAFLALNIVHRSPGELLEQLSFQQGAPWGFLLAEKLSVGLFGPDELSLRLLPLLAGLAALPVFWRVASFSLRGPEVVLALLLFALSPFLVIYSAEVKQYSGDVLASLLALWFLHAAREVESWRVAAALGAAGASLLWFAHASMIVLAAGGAVIGLAAVARRDWTAVRRLALVGGVWGASAALFFAFAWPKLAYLRGTVATGVHDVPFPPTSLADAGFLARRAGDFLEGAFGIYGRPWSTLIGLTAASLFLAGTLALWRRDRLGVAVLLAPLVAAAGGVASGLYPFAIRFLLFLVPLVIVVVAAGAGAGARALVQQRRQRRVVGATAVLAAAFLLGVAGVSTTRVLAAPEGQDVKPVLEEVRTVWRPGDSLYLHASSQYPARFYAEADRVNRSRADAVLWPVLPTSGLSGRAPALRSAPPTLVVGRFLRGGRTTFPRDLAGLVGRDRVWFVFTHVFRFTATGIADDLDRHLAALDAAGQRRATIRRGEARALLYDLRG